MPGSRAVQRQGSAMPSTSSMQHQVLFGLLLCRHRLALTCCSSRAPGRRRRACHQTHLQLGRDAGHAIMLPASTGNTSTPSVGHAQRGSAAQGPPPHPNPPHAQPAQPPPPLPSASLKPSFCTSTLKL